MEPYSYNYNYHNYSDQQSMILESQKQQNSGNMSQYSTSKSIYINQNFKGTQNLPNKVLINPNFLGSSKVHINPSYIKTKTIFINPQVIATQFNSVQTQTVVTSPKIINDVLVSTKNKWVRKLSKPLKNISPNNIVVINNTQSTSKNTKLPIKYTKYKIIRKDTAPKRKRRTSLNLRYKLIRSSSNKPKSPEKHVIKTEFKLDRRNSSERIKSKLYLLNKAYRLKIDHRNAILKKNKMTCVNNAKRMSRILNISGRKYKMDNNKMVLKLSLSSTDLNTSNRTVKIRNKIPLRKTLKTNNIPCPTYHRFGICQRHKRGMCLKVHNPDQIALCSKFLQGACHIDNCPLSHKVSLSKMSTCKFYLEGLCTKDGCPYLHVKVNSKVAICKQFLAGFCQLGKECDKRHEFLCPYFEQDGRCVKRNCQFPHKNVKSVRNQVKYNKALNSKQISKSGNTAESGCDIASSSNKRYYQDGIEKENCANSIDIDIDLKNTEIGDNNSVKKVTGFSCKRPQLGNLPTFIPL